MARYRLPPHTQRNIILSASFDRQLDKFALAAFFADGAQRLWRLLFLSVLGHSLISAMKKPIARIAHAIKSGKAGMIVARWGMAMWGLRPTS
jgi:hypothetical protein